MSLLFGNLFDLGGSVDLFDVGATNLFQNAISLSTDAIEINVDVVTPQAITSILPLLPGTIEIDVEVTTPSTSSNIPPLDPGVVADISVTAHTPTITIGIVPLEAGTIDIDIDVTTPLVSTQGVVTAGIIDITVEAFDASVITFIPPIDADVISDIEISVTTPEVLLGTITAPAERTVIAQPESRTVTAFAEISRTLIA